jgi:hypothetical protein
MSITGKSLREVTLVALIVAEQSPSAYSHRFSPKLFNSAPHYSVKCVIDGEGGGPLPRSRPGCLLSGGEGV